MPWPKGKPRSEKTRSKISATNVERHAERRAAHNAYMKEWQKANPEKTAVWKLRGQRRVRLQMIEDLGGKCVRCGFDDWRALQVDHIHGGGRKDPHYGGSRYAYAKHVRANRDKYQLLCANCNWIKRYETAEHGGEPRAKEIV
jgi:hypothetical protein